jgi:hypothetical protein
MQINGALRCGKLVLHELQEAIQTSAEEDDAKGSSSLDRMLHLVAEVKLEVDDFHYDDIRATAVSGSFRLLNQTFVCQRLHFVTMDGEVVLNGDVAIEQNGAMRSNLYVDARNVDISDMFLQCRNFGQDDITDEHLHGRMRSVFHLRNYISPGGDIVADSTYLLGDVQVTQGKLLNYSPLYDLSRFIRLSDLRDIHFSELNNTIEIRNQTIYIPTMYIESSAVNMELSGTHTFDNVIDYRIKVNLMNVLADKFKLSLLKSDEYERNAKGGINLYLTMTGTVNDPVIRYDKVAVKNQIVQDIKQEQEELREVLKHEFSRKEEIKESTDFETDDAVLEEIDWD